ncbi:MAG: acyl-CoA dehydrogenase family protein [Pseudomonadales bacterium]
MRGDSNPEAAAFADEIRTFIQRHWRNQGLAPQRRASAEFMSALVKQGWSVPDWPVAEGGTGWTHGQRYLFERELALADAPALDFFAANVLGTLLLDAGTSAQRDLHLPLIRENRARWCVHPSIWGAAPLIACDPTGNASEIRFENCAIGCDGAAGAHWLAALVAIEPDQSSLVLIPLDRTEVQAGLPPDRDQIIFDDLVLTAASILGREGAGQMLVEAALARARSLPWARIPRCRSALQRVMVLVADHPDLDQASRGSFKTRLAALEIELLGLDILEQRIAVAAGELSAEAIMVRIKSRELSTEIFTLMIEVLGYYALPDPDPLNLDNEGPIGGRYSQGAIEELFRYVGGLETMTERDQIAALKF